MHKPLMPVVNANLAIESANGTSPLCYHCGEAVSSGSQFSCELAGQEQLFCCPGCEAVATLIHDSGMAGFYQNRSAYSERPLYFDTQDAQNDEHSAHIQLYDDPDFAAGFSRVEVSGNCRSQLLLGGVNCAACTWLIEKSLLRIAGVNSAEVQLAQSRLDICFDPALVSLGKLVAAVSQLGYSVQPFKDSSARRQFEVDYKADLRRLAVAGIGMMQVGMFAIALHAGDLQGMETSYQNLLRWVSLSVATVVVYYSAAPFFSSAWQHLKRGALVMDLPVALAIGLAFSASLWATFSGSGQVYFDSVVMFTFFLLLGRFIERRGRHRAALTWSDVESKLPSAVSLYSDGQWQLQARTKIAVGDTILIKLGAVVPLDCRISKGGSALEEAAFNGEQLPRQVAEGDIAYAGSLNVEASLEAQVISTDNNSRLAALQSSVNAAQGKKPAVAQLADRVASWFIAAVLITTVATAFIWWQLAPDKALWIALSVLVVSCPCALALATPAALSAAAAGLRQRGVLVRGENALAALANSRHLVFDKTGTLTHGDLSVARIVPLADLPPETILAQCAALQRYSNHPIASAFDSINAAEGFSSVIYTIGAGLAGQLNGRDYRMGSAHHCGDIAPQLPAPPDQTLYWVALCRHSEPLAWVGLDDSPRPESKDVIDAAKAAGFRTELLSGDSAARVQQLGQELGFDEIHGAQSPQQKLQRVTDLQSEGAVVTMVGDGLNDGPVLSAANTSFAVVGASDLARTQADFTLLKGDLHAVLRSWQQAVRCRKVIRQNIIWALLYNSCGIPLAALGYVPPWAAALGMSLSSLLVVANSMRLQHIRTN